MNNFGQTFVAGTLNDRDSDWQIRHQSDVLTDWLLPQLKEQRQMAEQLIMDQESPKAKMKGLKEAGINPLTAGNGIAGSSSSTPSPSSSVNPLGDVAGAVGAVAGAGDSVASAISTLEKLNPEIQEIESAAKANLAKAGLDEANLNAVITDNKYRSENWEAELALKRQNFKNMKQEFSNMQARHREILTHCDEMIAQIELSGSQQDYYDVMQQKITEDLRWQKELNDWRIANNLHITESGVDGYTWNLLYNNAPDGDVDSFFDSFYGYCKSRSEAVNRGRLIAEDDYAYSIAHGRKNGENGSDILFRRIGSPFDFVGRLLSAFSNSSNVAGETIDNFLAKGNPYRIRENLLVEMNKLYRELDDSQVSETRKKQNRVLINQIQGALQLDNNELKDWFYNSYPGQR